MQALVYEDHRSILTANHPAPEPEPGEVLIRPALMGICSTDLEICRGYMQFDGVLGHEFVGVVEEVADSSDNRWVGKRVVGTINCACGSCDMCRADLGEHCRQRTVLGIAGRDGCFADAFTLPAANLFEVPENVDDDHAVFVEPLAAAFRLLQQLPIDGKPTITVLGDGRLGLLCAQLLKQVDAKVELVGKHPDKLRICERWGIEYRLLEEVESRNDQDIVVDCSGSANGLVTAMEMTRPRGTIVLKTTVSSAGATRPVDLSPIVINEIKLIGSRCGPFGNALAALSARKVDVTSLISRRMSLADGVRALEVASKPGVIKVLLEP